MKITDMKMEADPGKAFFTKEGIRLGTVLWQSSRKRSDAIVELDETNPMAPENIVALQERFTALIDTELDAFAKTRGYTNIITAASYAGDKDPQFAMEGQYCKDLRSDVYRLGYQLIGEYLSKGTIPTWEEVKGRLPEMKWPDSTEENAS